MKNAVILFNLYHVRLLLIKNFTFLDMEFEGNWPEAQKDSMIRDMIVLEDFISPGEETALLEEIEPYLKR